MVDHEPDVVLHVVQRCVVEAKNQAARGEAAEELLDLTDYLIALTRSEADETEAFDAVVGRIAVRNDLHVIGEILADEPVAV